MSVEFVPIPSGRFSSVLEKYKEQFESSTKFSRFFQLLAIRFGKLSTKQQKTFQFHFGCLDEGFFKRGDFLGLFKTVLKPLYAKHPNSLQMYFDYYELEHIDTAMEVLELGQFFVELFLPRNISDIEYINRLNDAGISDGTIVDLLLARRETFLSCQEMVDVEVKLKEFFRDGFETNFFCEILLELISSNPKIIEFLWNHCDLCGKMIENTRVNEEIRKCTDCGGKCQILLEPTPSPAQVSDPIQELATEITTARISFGPDAERFAYTFLGKGIFQLNELSFLGEETFASIVKEIGLNEVQVLKLSAFRKK